MSAVLVHDAVDNGQSHASALVRFLGREKRLEHVALNVGRDARSGIGDREFDKRAVHGLAARRAAEAIRAITFGEFDRELADTVHRVPAVNTKVDQHLFELQRIVHGDRQRRRRLDHNRDAGGEC